MTGGGGGGGGRGGILRSLVNTNMNTDISFLLSYFVLRFNVPVNNFSDKSGRSQRFKDINQYCGE